MSKIKKVKAELLIPLDDIEDKIYFVRGQKVMLDSELAKLYGVETGALVRAVKRNIERFPEEFMFQLTNKEFMTLKCQIGISKTEGRGGRRTPPYAFTEQGVAMLSSVLRSKKAIQINILIMKTFVKIREIAHPNILIAKKVEELQKKLQIHDEDIQTLFETINLIALASVQKKIKKSPKEPPKKIGFH